MDGRMKFRMWLGCVAALGWAGMAAGQISDEQNKLLARRAAEADCFRKIAETVKGLRINSTTFVRDFVTESDVIEAELDEYVKGVRLGEPRYYEDGICEVRAEVTVANVITRIKEIHTRHYKGDRVSGTDIVDMKQHVEKEVIEVIGSGAARPDLPPLPDVIVQQMGPPPVSAEPVIPDIWRQVPPNERLMAVRAADLDAKRRLLERIKGLRINSNTLVKDFVTEYDEIMSEASGLVVGAREKGRAYYHDNELIVEKTWEVDVESVITHIKEMHTRHYKGSRVTGTDIVNIRQTVKRNTFEATGSGVPKLQFVQQASADSVPPWITETIQAEGSATDPAIETAQGKLKAARAAELDAKRNLAERVHGLHISSNTLVRDFITQYDDISAQLNSVLVGAIVDRTDWGDGTATVMVSLPARDVWHVVHDHMVVVGRQ